MANTLNLGTNGNWATKKDSLLAYNSENGNFKPLAFNFDRASSATVINKDGLIETVGSGEPRIDYKDDSKGALLLEPTRTNNITYSNDFLDSSWLPTGLTVSSGVISPDGTANAFTISNTAASGIIQKAVSVTGTRTVSIFAKKGTHRYLRLGAYGGTSSYANFDLENGVVSDGANAEIEDYGNGWYRCICHSADGTTGGVQIFPSNNSVGAGTTNGSIEIYAAQLEQGSYATSYIPTQGGAVTRVAESCSQTPPSGVIGQTEATLFVDAEIKGFKNDNTLISVHNGSFSEYIIISGNISGKINAYIFDNGSQQAAIISPNYSLGRFKCALSYSLNSVSFYINGIKIGSDTSATMPTTNVLDLGSLSFFNAPLNGKINQSLVYNTALTDQELINLTKI